MEYLLFVFFSGLIITLINFFFQKKKIFLDIKQKSYHKKFTGHKHVPFVGGIFLLFSIFFLSDLNLYFLSILLIIFLIGFFSDLFILNSIKVRFLLQIIFIILFIILADLKISQTKIFLIDQFLTNNLFNIFFVCLCILIVINGSNFIDGVNINLLSYYIIIYIILLLLSKNQSIDVNIKNLDLFLTTLIIIFILNFSQKLYMGDSGAYLIGFYTSINLINFYNDNLAISSFFIVLLLWYPAFENFFSIVRKKNLDKSPLKPDNKHLHHLIFLFLKKNKLITKYTNTATGLIINVYNLFVLIIGFNYFYHSQILSMLVIFNIFIYCFVYYKLSVYITKGM